MNIWQFILVSGLAVLASLSLSKVASALFHRKWSVCDIDMMSNMYITIIFDALIGCPLFGLIYWMDSASTSLLGKSISALVGVVVYGFMIYVMDIRRYSKLRDSLELLKIESNEELEEFIKKQENI